MKSTKELCLFIMLFMSTTKLQGQSSDFYAKETFIDIDRIPRSVRDRIWYGLGLDMTNPFSPLPADESPFLVKSSGQVVRSNVERQRILFSRMTQNFSFRQAHVITKEELENFFSAELDASAVFVSLEARIQQAQKYISNTENLYIVLENYITNADISDFPLNWQKGPVTESGNSDSSFLWDIFKRKYGSHYVQTVSFGYRFEVLATLNSTGANNKESVSVALNSFFADGRLSIENSSIIQRSTSNIQVRVTCGNLTNEQGQEIPPIIMSINDCIEFFKKIKDGKIFVTACPISFKAKSYLSTLYPNYPKTLSLYNVSKQSIDYAIPPGTIIAWIPIGPLPGGWSICDGTNGTPDLRDKFILGSDVAQVGQTGGSFVHNHNGGKTGPPLRLGATNENEFHNVEKDGRILVTGTVHQHTISEANNTPPFMKLIYIMKRP